MEVWRKVLQPRVFNYAHKLIDTVTHLLKGSEKDLC